MVNLNGRKARMLLVYPDYTDRDVKGKVSGGNYSEGLASISAVLKQGGHQVELLHLLYLHEEAEFKEKLREKGKFDIIGFSIRTTAFPDAQLYIRWTREVWPDVFIICGSYHCTLVPGEVLAVPEVDCVWHRRRGIRRAGTLRQNERRRGLHLHRVALVQERGR